MKSNKIKLLTTFIIVILIMVFLLTKKYSMNLDTRFDVQSIIIQKGIKDTNQIELINQDEIDNFLADLDLKNWHKSKDYDLKCGPEFTIFIDEKMVVEILCYKNKLSYCRINKDYYASEQNIYDIINSIYSRHDNE